LEALFFSALLEAFMNICKL